MKKELNEQKNKCDYLASDWAETMKQVGITENSNSCVMLMKYHKCLEISLLFVYLCLEIVQD